MCPAEKGVEGVTAHSRGEMVGRDWLGGMWGFSCWQSLEDISSKTKTRGADGRALESEWKSETESSGSRIEEHIAFIMMAVGGQGLVQNRMSQTYYCRFRS